MNRTPVEAAAMQALMDEMDPEGAMVAVITDHEGRAVICCYTPAAADAVISIVRAENARRMWAQAAGVDEADA